MLHWQLPDLTNAGVGQLSRNQLSAALAVGALRLMPETSCTVAREDRESGCIPCPTFDGTALEELALQGSHKTCSQIDFGSKSVSLHQAPRLQL